MSSYDSIEIDENNEFLYYDNLVLTTVGNDPKGYVMRYFYEIAVSRKIAEPNTIIVFSLEMDTLDVRFDITSTSNTINRRTAGVNKSCTSTFSTGCIYWGGALINCTTEVFTICSGGGGASSNTPSYPSAPDPHAECARGYSRNFLGLCVDDSESRGGNRPNKNPGTVRASDNELEREIENQLNRPFEERITDF